MSGILSELLSLLLLYNYAALALAVAIGAWGVPLPIALLLVADGAFASQGYTNVWFSLIIAVVANDIGDVAQFALAEEWGRPTLRFFRIDKDPTIGWVERYIRSHTRSTVFWTRFVNATGAVGNVFAGLAGVPLVRFLVWDTLGNIVSIAPYLALGYVLGINWQNAISLIDTSGWVALGVVTGAVAIWWFWYHKRR